MTKTMELEKIICDIMPSNPQISYCSSFSPAIQSLATSKTCGLAILLDKLLVNGKHNPSKTHLIRTLINRLHHNSIAITASSDDNPENFILNMVETASQFSLSEDYNRSAIDSARLLTKSIEAFEMNKVDFSTLEHNWKEFVFQFYRSKLRAYSL